MWAGGRSVGARADEVVVGLQPRLGVRDPHTVSGHCSMDRSAGLSAAWSPADVAGSGRQACCAATSRSTCRHRLSHRCHRSATCTASGAPSRAPPAYPPGPGRSPPRRDERAGQSPASRPRNTSTGRCPRLIAPRTVTWSAGGSDRARISRSSVDRLTPMPSLAASREPTRPASANPTAPALPVGRDCVARAARSIPALARRTCWCCSRRGRRRTGPSTSPRPAVPRRADQPDAASSGCAPESTPARTATPRPTRPRMRSEHHLAVDPGDPVDHHRREMRKQTATALTSHSPDSTTSADRRRAPQLRRLGFTESAPEPDNLAVHTPISRARRTGRRGGPTEAARRALAAQERQH